jgi:penicillin-binding protein A
MSDYYNEGPQLNTRRKTYLPYVLVPIIVMLIFAVFFVGPKGEADVNFGESRYLGRDALKHITPETIEKYGLSINPDLQRFVAETALKYRVHFEAIAVMDAYSGDILALYGKDRDGEDCSIPMDAFLAASVFKIVTASAAIDRGMTPLSPVTYRGSPYTLYKGQLDARQDRWSQQITLAQAFAKSNNVVFGKIGTQYLGDHPILLEAMRLGFWKPIMRECWSKPSAVFVPETDYNLAEMACGFNHETRMSPVHAAQIVSAIVNGGRMVTPRLIRSMGVESTRVMSDANAESLHFMMAETLKTGTVASGFRSSKYDRIMKDLNLGAKSGSIDSRNPEGRLNWFVGYAEHPERGAITVACLMLRDAYFLIKADDMARLIIKQYFSEQGMVAGKDRNNNTSRIN